MIELLRFGKSLGPVGLKVKEIRLLSDTDPDVLEKRFERFEEKKK